MNCEECEQNSAKLNCIQCGQLLCNPCDKKIHNKGKRVLHKRDQIEDKLDNSVKLESCKSLQIQKQDAHVLRHEQHKERFKQITQNQSSQNKLPEKEELMNLLPQVHLVNLDSIEIPKDCEMQFQTNLQTSIVEQYFFKQAYKGELMIHQNEFQRFLKSNNIHKINQSKNVIIELERIGLINITIRKFGDSDPIQFVSLSLQKLSLQSLYWVLLNLRKDEMTPTDKLVMSRIKECFGIKISIQEWNHYLAGFYKLQDSNGLIVFPLKIIKQKIQQEQNCYIKMTKCPIDLLNKSETNLTLSQQFNNDTLLLFTIEDGQQWHMLDAQQMNLKYKSQWKLFIQFLKEFFDSNITLTTSQNTQSVADFNQSTHSNSSSQASGAQSVPVQKNQDNSKWVRSVESGVSRQDQSSLNPINQSYQSCQTQKKKTKKGQIKPPKSISKAIPGGKYGCAQLLKCCGPLELRVSSLGVLCLMIQEAINRSILIYYKTLLIKPNTNIAFDFNDYLSIFDSDNSNYQQILVQDEDNNLSAEKIKLQAEQQNKLLNVQEIIRDILKEYKKGVSLARLPKLIQRKLSFPFDLHELGFTKLKLLIQSIENAIILNDGTTYASIIFEQQDSTLPTENNPIQICQQTDQTESKKEFEQQQQFKQQQPPQQLLQQSQQQQQQQNLYNPNFQNQFDYYAFGCNNFEEYMFKINGYRIYSDNYQQYCQNNQQDSGNQKQYQKFHQKSQSTNLPNYSQYQFHSQNNFMWQNMYNQQQFNQRQQQNLKADSFLADMQLHNQDIPSNSLTLQSFHTNPQNREFFMIQEECSHNETDANVKFIEELLKESDDVDCTKKKDQKRRTENQFQSLGCWPWGSEEKGHIKQNTHGQSNYEPNEQEKVKQNLKIPMELHSWDFDNN